MNVADVMTADPVTVGPTETVRDAMATLYELDIRHLPVVDGSRLVGMLSDRDLRAQSLPAVTESDLPGVARTIQAQPVSELMQSDIVTVGPEDDLADAVDLMIDHKVGAVPVVDAENDRLVGIVSYIDVLQVARDLV
jgi:acetoin utilization protein AcuB